MDTVLYLGLIAVVACIFGLGRLQGIHEVHSAFIKPGCWVEVVGTVKGTFQNKTIKLCVGEQGIIAGEDNFGRFSLWIGTDWSKSYDDEFPIVYQISKIGGLKPLPPHRIHSKTRESTLAAYAKYREDQAAFNEKLFG